jgi:membrane protein
VPPDPRSGIVHLIRQRFMSFTLVLAIGFVLLVSLVISAGLAALNRYLGGLVPGNEMLWMAVAAFVSLTVSATLFAALFKLLPDAEVRWADVWLGGWVTAALFELGKLALGVYLGQAAIASAYGAAGSLVVLLVWVYYSAQIVFLGAEVTRVYARHYGSGIVPDRRRANMASTTNTPPRR